LKRKKKKKTRNKNKYVSITFPENIHYKLYSITPLYLMVALYITVHVLTV